MAGSSTPSGATAEPSSANAESDKLPGFAAVWEYEERTIRRHVGWVPMSQCLSDQLEEAYAIQQDTVIRIQDNEDPPLVWKLDLGKKTQRRLVNGQDNCSRRIRRIFLRIDTVGSSEAGDAA